MLSSSEKALLPFKGLQSVFCFSFHKLYNIVDCTCCIIGMPVRPHCFLCIHHIQDKISIVFV